MDISFSLFNFYYLFYYLFYILSLILTVAFFTLLERKVIASIQRRKGPDYIGIFGIFQPIADALKLILKEFIFPKMVNSFIFLFAPFLVFFLSILCWFFIPLTQNGSFYQSDYTLLWILMLSTVNSYSIFIAGWASNSKYAFLGSLRSLSQFLSYEISLTFLILPIIFITGSFNLSTIYLFQSYTNLPNFVWMFPNFCMMFFCLLAETNRSPFDLPEAEAELVAGYNVEYSSLPFAFFFLGEYLNILTASSLFILFYLNGFFFSQLIPIFDTISYFFLFLLKLFFIIFIIIWVRATLPRIRYDHLLSFCWKYLLLFSSSFFWFYVTLYYLFCYLF